MLFSVRYSLPNDRSGVIFSLSQVQNFLGDEGDSAPFKPPKQKGAHAPSVKPLMYLLVGGPRRKSGNFCKQHFSNKNKAFVHHLRHKKGV
jgi:hypothetical protein